VLVLRNNSLSAYPKDFQTRAIAVEAFLADITPGNNYRAVCHCPCRLFELPALFAHPWTKLAPGQGALARWANGAVSAQRGGPRVATVLLRGPWGNWGT
jgi:hypothetical protein